MSFPYVSALLFDPSAPPAMQSSAPIPFATKRQHSSWLKAAEFLASAKSQKCLLNVLFDNRSTLRGKICWAARHTERIEQLPCLKPSLIGRRCSCLCFCPRKTSHLWYIENVRHAGSSIFILTVMNCLKAACKVAVYLYYNCPQGSPQSHQWFFEGPWIYCWSAAEGMSLIAAYFWVKHN